MAESSPDEDRGKNGAVAKELDPKLKKNILRRSFSILGHLFHRTSREDFERKLQSLSKEEATVHTRMKRRSQTWRKLAQGVIVYSVIMELLILGLAVISTRAPELSWQMRAIRVLPVFVFPVLAILLYTLSAKYYRMRERKDQKTLDRLREERQAKINELKERTNYYLTQQLIQKYDSDPTAKEAAARVLAAKLGAESGLKLASESSQADAVNAALAEAVTMAAGEEAESSGLRRRSSRQRASNSTNQHATSSQGTRYDSWPQSDQSAGKSGGGGWVARLAAMLVGEDPNQCYALICRNCQAHNGLSRKEEFPFITYYCPHCNFLNGPQQLPESEGGNDSKELVVHERILQPAENGLNFPKAREQSFATVDGCSQFCIQEVGPEVSTIVCKLKLSSTGLSNWRLCVVVYPWVAAS
ncbi:hypothetical protein GOP47_0017766 [Adiantum capillus-veneris]|uniref:Lunapark zinc ribbon domain-containing protein n=1 Tax=Adiantum capillus-veneris TaxID=13818 RepID=A0A9D4Z9H9_ADICA|nr:hypothetical protein GOP47_0017766 [Adiantum capillus-veneris]